MAVVSYDGTDWSGWHTQAHGKTVQDALEARLSGVSQGRHCPVASPHAMPILIIYTSTSLGHSTPFATDQPTTPPTLQSSARAPGYRTSSFAAK